ALWRREGGADPADQDAGAGARAEEYPRQLRGAGLDRVSRRRLGPGEDRQSETLPVDLGRYSLRPLRPAGGGRYSRVVPLLGSAQLGDRADGGGGWRTDAGLGNAERGVQRREAFRAVDLHAIDD